MKKALFAVAAVTVLTLGGLGFYSTSITSGDKILNNVHINNIDVSNMTKEKAFEALNTMGKETGINIILFDEKYRTELDASKFGYGFDVEEGVKKAFGVGRDSNVITNMMTTMAQTFLNANEAIELPVKLIEDKFDEVFDNVALEVESELKEGVFDIINGAVVFEEGTDGRTIKREELKTSIINDLEQRDPFKTDYKKDYSFELTYEIQERQINNDDMRQITGIIGDYTTKFDQGISGRAHNIRLAASSIDGKILLPGETLSYNESTGRRTYENGYKDASVIVSGEYEQGVGGGICQVSSTLYNAALYANLDIVERRNHSIPTKYTPISRDAVVFFGVIDLVIKNPYDYPIVIKSFTEGGSLTVRVYGNVETAPKVELSSETIETKARGVVYINDSNLPVGTEKVKFAGRDQVKGRLYKTVNGVKTVVATDTYSAKAKEILVGVKVIETPPAPTITEANNDTVDELIGD